MIASINGVMTLKSTTALRVEVQGIGYQVFVPLSTYYRLPEEKEQIFLHIHTHVREDALQLFGFISNQEKALFLLLIGVSGVGPKLALNILSGINLSELVHALREGQIKTLRAIPGVGPKMAGRLVLELKEKVSQLDFEGIKPFEVDSERNTVLRNEVSAALVNLGYHRKDVKRTLETILKAQGDNASTEDLIKEGLKRLAKV